MKHFELSGWQRLGISLSAIWGIAIAATIICNVFPSMRTWLVVFDPNDPLNLFPHISWIRAVRLLLGPIALLWIFGATCSWILHGFEKRLAAPYLKRERLADVLSLLQVLALDTYSHRSEEMLQSELQGKPSSAKDWSSLAREHPEFFRLRVEAEHPISLIARHVLPDNQQGRKTLPADYTAKLMQLAVELHDRQLRRVQAWQAFIPMLVAVIAGAISLVGIFVKG